MRVLILYTELAAYTIASLKEFLHDYPDSELLIIHYPINPEAPFVFNELPRSKWFTYDSQKHTEISKLVEDFNPNILLCSGWINKFYIELTNSLTQVKHKVLMLDTPWQGSWKQKIWSLIAKKTMLKSFNYAFVAGDSQALYAKKLGFHSKCIYKGLYVADVDLYQTIGEQKLANKDSVYPKTLISVARYIPQKNLNTLWQAFINANAKQTNKWELHCYGLGQLFEERVEHESIFHHGFVQPSNMKEEIMKAGVFVLPSVYEPWGVVVHEMSLSALPLVLSNKVGAASLFLDLSNGYSFSPLNQAELQSALEQIMNKSEDELWQMAENSYQNGLKLTQQMWSKSIHQIYNSTACVE